MHEGRSGPIKSTKSGGSGFRNAGQINPGIYGGDAGQAASAPAKHSHSLAFGNPDQAIASDDRTFGGYDDVAKGDQLCQMGRRNGGGGGSDRDLDQGGEFFGRQKLWRMYGHR